MLSIIFKKMLLTLIQGVIYWPGNLNPELIIFMRKSFLLTFALASLVQVSSAQIFQDDFESGTMSKWTLTGSSALTIAPGTNAIPEGGNNAALLNTSTDRMHHNIIADNGGAEVGNYFLFTSYWYDNSGTATRFFNEVRGYSGGTGLPNGGTAASGTLFQLLAIGKYNTVTMAGEVYNGTKYQARVVAGTTTGWFNLDAAGSPDRSTGWHKFSIQRLDDGTTLNFFVDDILSRTITGSSSGTIDTVVLGPGLGSTVGDAWVDGVALIPEPSSLALGLLGLGLLLRKRIAG